MKSLKNLVRSDDSIINMWSFTIRNQSMSDNIYVAEIITGIGETRNFMYCKLENESSDGPARSLAASFGGRVVSVHPVNGFVTGGLMCEIVRA